MKKIVIMFMTLMIINIMLTSCQKDKAKQESSTEHEPITQESAEVKPCTLTESEQQEFEKFEGQWESPSRFASEAKAIKYLKMLVKCDATTIRWYQVTKLAGEGENESEKKKQVYAYDIATALSTISIKSGSEGFNLAVDVLKTKKAYPDAMAQAAKVLKFAHDTSIIPLLREVAKNPSPMARLEAAGTLLVLGDGDAALPVLEVLAEQEGYVGALYYLFSEPGKIIDERGYKIVEKALNNPNPDVRISAAKLLLDANKIAKDKAEEASLRLLSSFKNSEEYGITFDSKRGIVPLPGREKNFEKAKEEQGRDWRAIEKAIAILIQLKRKKAIPALEQLAKNPGGSYLSNQAKDALEFLKKQ
jgi:hypothetical protein